ncbi:MAG: efflux RND transporter periplasmic adaptor subunit [Nitrospiraceae bacterium]|nr:efflux RND transporter periplasmic adaptor subunit [Nitrospiraceae bacterium]
MRIKLNKMIAAAVTVCVVVLIATGFAVRKAGWSVAGAETEDAPATHEENEAHDHAEGHEEPDDHDGDDHDGGGHAPNEASGAHEDHEEQGSDEDEHADHTDEGKSLRLTPQQRKRFGIVLRTAGPGSLRNEVRLPGEIVFNDDRVIHVVPRVPGIAIEIRKTLGDRVKAGETLLIGDSAELASAKLDYVAAVTQVGCCQFELPRAQAIHDNTLKMLDLLESSPSVEQLRESVLGEMGEYRSRLISAYAQYVWARKEYEREKALMAKKISSEGDFLAAESAFKKAEAENWGTRDSVAFEVKQELREATRKRHLAELQVETTEQKLHMFGLSEAEVDELAARPLPADEATKASALECTDPNCKDCAGHQAEATENKAPASGLKQASLGSYEIKAPFDGLIVEKHIALGERLGEDSEIFMIADMNSVWVNLTVYTKNLASVRDGQDIVLQVDHSGAQARGKVTMLTPFVEESTRSATARVVLDNSDGRWMPGTFVTGFISTTEDELAVVVPRNAVQNIEGRDVVFVEREGDIEMTPVTVGRTDRTNAEILAGLEPGTPYVTDGAFQLKATLITSSLGSHSGHGH